MKLRGEACEKDLPVDIYKPNTVQYSTLSYKSMLYLHGVFRYVDSFSEIRACLW